MAAETRFAMSQHVSVTGHWTPVRLVEALERLSNKGDVIIIVDNAQLRYSQILWMTAESGGVFGGSFPVDKLHSADHLGKEQGAV
jgi:hypothetical protein